MALNINGNALAMSAARHLSNPGGLSHSEQKLRGINKEAASLLKESRLNTSMSVAKAKDDVVGQQASPAFDLKQNKLEIKKSELSAQKLPSEQLKAQQEALEAANKEQQSLSPVGLRLDFSA